MYSHGLICLRAQPLHLGHVELINKAMDICQSVTIVIGSSQESRTERNPFSIEERKKMFYSVFNQKKLNCISVEDINNPPKWVSYILSILLMLSTYSHVNNEVDVYFAGTKWDAELFQKEGIKTIILDRSLSNLKSGTELRKMIKEKDDTWKRYVPLEVQKIIEEIKI